MENSHNEVLSWLSGYIEGITGRDFINKSEVLLLIKRLESKLELLEPFKAREISEDELENDLPF